MRDYRFESMAEISWRTGGRRLIYAIFFGPPGGVAVVPPSDTSQLFLILELFKGKTLLCFKFHRSFTVHFKISCGCELP